MRQSIYFVILLIIIIQFSHCTSVSEKTGIKDISMVVQEAHGEPRGKASFIMNDKYMISTSNDEIKMWTLDGVLLRTIYTKPCNFGKSVLSVDKSMLITAGTLVKAVPESVCVFNVNSLTSKTIDEFPYTISEINSNEKFLAYLPMEDMFSSNYSPTFDLIQGNVSDLEKVSSNSNGLLKNTNLELNGMFHCLSSKVRILPGDKGFVVNYSRQEEKDSVKIKKFFLGVFDIQGKKIKEFNLDYIPKNQSKGFYTLPSDIAISKDGRYIATGLVEQKNGLATDFSGQVYLIDLIKDTVTKMSEKSSSSNILISSSRIISAGSGVDNDSLATVGKEADTNIYIWDYSGKLLKKISYPLNGPSDISLSEKEDFFSTTSYDGSIKVWSLSGDFVRTMGGKNKGITESIISPDGKFIAAAYTDNKIRIWDKNSGKLIHKLVGHTQNIFNLTFSNDSKFIISGSGSYYQYSQNDDISIRVWNIDEEKQIAKFSFKEKDPRAELAKFASGVPRGITFTDNNKKIIFTFGQGIAYDWHALYIADISANKIIKKVEDVGRGLLWNNQIITFNPDRDTKRIRYFDLSGNLINQEFSRENPFDRIKNSDSIYSEGSSLIFKPGNEKEAVHMLSLGDDWISFSPDGYFDSSINVGENLKMVSGLTPFNIDQFAAKFNRPDIILKRLGNTNQELLDHYKEQYLRRLKRLNLSEDDLLTELHVPVANIVNANQKEDRLDLRLKFQDEKYNLKKYNVYINDVPLFSNGGKDLKGNDSGEIQESLKLSSGENKVEVTCLNEKGAESFRTVKYFTNTKNTNGNLYYLGFGVSNYKNSSLNLQYAHKDVLDLNNLFESKLKKKFDSVQVKTFINEEVTPENIKAAKEFFNKTDVDDTVILFISGHGVHDKDKDASYYYLTHNTDIENLSKTAANFELVEDLLQGIPARKKLFLMDTCESGEIEDTYESTSIAMANSKGLKSRSIKGLTMDTKAKKDKPVRKYLFDKDRYIYNDLVRRSGAIVFSSSKGGELSYEDPKFENGLFTESIIKAIEGGEADSNKDGQISTKELRDYVHKNVSKLTDGAQNPTIDRDNIFIKFKLPTGR